MARIPRRADQPLRRRNMERVRLNLKIVTEIGLADHFVKQMLRPLLSNVQGSDRVLISGDRIQIFDLPAEQHMQRGMMKPRLISGVRKRALRNLRPINAGHNRLMAAKPDNRRLRVMHRCITGGQRVGDLILHTRLLITGKPHHGDRHLRFFGKRR